MKPRTVATVGLLLLATCSEDFQAPTPESTEASSRSLGTVPPSEVAVWKKIGSVTNPDGRYLQAAAFDENRKVVVMFGGTVSVPYTSGIDPNNETWEWSPATGKWTNRTGTGTAPDARTGAAMAFDSVRGKFLLFGGRAGSGFNLEDTWEWDPATGEWTNVSASGAHPSARSQHRMVYEKGSGKVLLYGGGRSDPNSGDAAGVSVSLSDTWELDPTTYAWTQLAPATNPGPRHDFGMVWDSAHGKAILFGGMETEIPGAAGYPKQDTWEWDPEASDWIEQTSAGSKPSQRYGHAMAFDGSRGMMVVFGGFDISTGGGLNDLWEFEPTTATWKQRLTGTEGGIASPRMYASLLADNDRGRLLLIAGAAAYDPYGGSGGRGYPPPRGYGAWGSREVWEIDPAGPTFTDRTSSFDMPPARYGQAMAYSPATQRTYVFGGYDSWSGMALDDFWEWDGSHWTQISADVRPPARSDAALAYDPVRKSLILYGGWYDNYSSTPFGDTWEFGADGKWKQLEPASSPEPLVAAGMVTDTTRGKILLFGGMAGYDYTYPGGYKDPMRNDVWEWDGSTVTWTKRSPDVSTVAPSPRPLPKVAYDEGRQKLFVFDGTYYGSNPSSYWEWDPITAGWSYVDTGDFVGYGYSILVAYDSVRRREVMLNNMYGGKLGEHDTWEIDTSEATLYVRSLTEGPSGGYGSAMVFDSARGVVVLFGGQSVNTGWPISETWEYKVTNLGNGEGCTAAFASLCATGFCVDGVCCSETACTGACKSCNVAGSKGSCVLAAAGTEVPGSCADGQACDGSGACKTKNGQACSAADTCASGFCVDGVCCDGACSGPCTSCNQPGRTGKCSGYAAGTDPQNECGDGTGICKATCDGVGSCAYPSAAVVCGDCMLCNGAGECNSYDWTCGYRGTGGYYGGTGGWIYWTGGTGGYVPNVGGAGGAPPVRGGAAGGTPNAGGSAGSIPVQGGAAGGTPNVGGAAGGIPVQGGAAGGGTVQGGAAGGLPVVGGAAGGIPNAGGAAGNSARIDGGASNLPGFGGNLGRGDAAVGDAGKANLHKSGCGCGVGQPDDPKEKWTAPLLFAGVAFLLLRRRRRRASQ